ncbi:MAG: glutamine--fructose-6-phosphate transaminase (isomerizing) [Sphingomonadaceae bacterium]|uniref:glutamine--fructose-6-phosphate transaminase (isomerizing) n=1 Tax=Thermaurantiacus sp. TaxID=2820283 RepID=UPI00298F2217|nr:glutamine--fructose-6-phosphate transaminase (isomerizing) [Thermaurantiacus sp.]MCS6987332.1 glutamine--fructose-6-phosphate transaminase (isomerizing) [Sphingomonadaceae bacterium]MDW8414553.1 glutamine--fructose-6-phosphate transaminase (isomerizing) [Thermaurantiacus sp.]
MCGIVAILGRGDVAPRLVEGLRRLEYRGYDSAGLCTLSNGRLLRRRAEGKLKNLETLLAAEPLPGAAGIAHTRWATHGRPSERNAHPHLGRGVAVVHNGIIENFRELRAELEGEGVVFESETDTEVVGHLVARELARGAAPEAAVAAALPRLHGAFALALLFEADPDLLVGARQGAPLTVGLGEGEVFLGSDALALAGWAEWVIHLEDGDWVMARRHGVTIHDRDGRRVNRPVVASGVSAAQIEKGAFRHFMAKEIHEQPLAVAQTLQSYLKPHRGEVALPMPDADLASVRRVTIVACGTSFYAGMVGRYWIERLARVPVEVDLASEFRYRDPVLDPHGLCLFISQSGETADTLAALRHAKAAGQRVAAIVNVPASAMAREADLLLPTHAGPEIGVASTKAFTCQLAVLAVLAANLARAQGRLPRPAEEDIVRHLMEAPAALNAALAQEPAIAAVANDLARARDVLFLGRGPDYPLALEGALKLKEISYIHAEGYAAGEMKHGPIALVDDGVPVIVLAAPGPVLPKTLSNMQEVLARGGRVILVSDAKGIAAAGPGIAASVEMPAVPALIAPMVYAVAVQLLAYHVALARGTDVDQPRNLAKSVTVE